MKLLILNSPEIFVMLALLGVIVFIFLIVFLVNMWRDLRLTKRLRKEKQIKNDLKSDFFSSEHLTQMEYREILLNNIEDGRLYQITSPNEIVIACAKEYNAKDGRLACYAYFSIIERGVYTVSTNLYVCEPFGNSHSRKIIGKTTLDIYYDQNPDIFMSGDVMISPFVADGDYQRFKFYMLKAGLQWDIEKGEQHRLGCYTYRLKTKV